MGRWHEWDDVEADAWREWEPDYLYQLRHNEQDKLQARGLYKDEDEVHRSQMERNWHPDPYDCI